MRQFSSYGPINQKMHYFVPREELLTKARTYLIGENPDEGGHYITVWAPRQTGKTSLLRDIYWELVEDSNYAAAYIILQNLAGIDDSVYCMNTIIDSINRQSGLQLPPVSTPVDFQQAFSCEYLAKPLILIIDEFDALQEGVINALIAVFRNIYHLRVADTAPSPHKHYLLHGMALIGVRGVVGVESKSGSPFNVQKSLQVHNLTATEVNNMYHWYEEETGQKVEQAVIDRIYHVTRGQPGLVSWFGELLTSTYNDQPDEPLTMNHFDSTYTMALQALPNNTINNIISKAKIEPYRHKVLELFKTDSKTEFRFEKEEIGYLYMNGIIDYEKSGGVLYVKFPCQFIQEKLFGHFSDELVRHKNQLLAEPFMDLSPVINEQEINIPGLLELYQEYYTRNKDELTEYAQRRVDMRIMEVVYHFQLYSWLDSFLSGKNARVIPEFPTGNGKIDLLIRYAGKCYGLELKSFSDLTELNNSIKQAAGYGKSLGLNIITLVVFVDKPIPGELQARYTRPFEFKDRAKVKVFFIVTA